MYDFMLDFLIAAPLFFFLYVLLGGFSWKRKDCRQKFGRIRCSAQSPPPAWPGRAVVEPDYKPWDGQKPISIIGSTGSIGTQVKLYVLPWLIVGI